jgi:hypothetical protein
MHRSRRILVLFALSLNAIACHKPKSTVLLYAPEGHIKLEADSIIRWPELAYFPIRVRLFNYTNKKVVLVFDTISNKYEHQVNNLFLTSGKTLLI